MQSRSTSGACVKRWRRNATPRKVTTGLFFALGPPRKSTRFLESACSLQVALVLSGRTQDILGSFSFAFLGLCVCTVIEGWGRGEGAIFYITTPSALRQYEWQQNSSAPFYKGLHPVEGVFDLARYSERKVVLVAGRPQSYMSTWSL